jgi:hypothetical protein
MNRINPPKALYIKLGRKGEYEKASLPAPGWLHVGWNEINHELCLSGNWEEARRINLTVYANAGTATRQTNQLQLFYKSDQTVLWITFYHGHLYWCFAKEEIIPQTDGSRIRPTMDGWRNHDIKGVVLDSSRLSGSLLALQSFRGTICNVGELEYLVRKINAETLPVEQKAIDAREALIQSLVGVIQNLHPKEFELLTDLIFRQAGWQRLAVVGETTKDIDLYLKSPISQERYFVQVKSKVSRDEFRSFSELAQERSVDEQYYLVVHQPNAWINDAAKDSPVNILLAKDITRLAVNYGLVDWLIAKSK